MVVTLMLHNCGCSHSFLLLYSSLYLGFKIQLSSFVKIFFEQNVTFLLVTEHIFYCIVRRIHIQSFIFQSQCLFLIGGAAGGSREGAVFLPEEQLSTPYYSQSGGKRTQYQGERLCHDNKVDPVSV